MSFTWSAGDRLTAERLNQSDPESVARFIQNEHNIFELFLENFFAGKITPFQGLFFDGFSDTSKEDSTEEAITSGVSSGQADVDVADGSVFSVNQEVDIFDTTNGNFETLTIQTIVTNKLTMSSNFANAYTTSGFVSRSSVDVDTPNRQLEIKSGLLQGNYRSTLQSFQQSIGSINMWATRTFLNQFNLDSAISAGATTLTILGDQTSNFANGDTIDISTSDNLIRERKTLTAVPSFSGGVTTLTFSATTNAFGTSDFVERVDVLPEISVVNKDADESFQTPTFTKAIVDFANNEVEDEYNLVVSPAEEDVIIKLKLSRVS